MGRKYGKMQVLILFKAKYTSSNNSLLNLFNPLFLPPNIR